MTTIYHFEKRSKNIEHKFKGFYWNKECTKRASPKEINEKVEDLQDPFITLKLSALEKINLQSLLKLKIEEVNNGLTFYCKFE